MIYAKENSDLLLFGQETERIKFRQLLETDFDAWLRFCEHPDSLRYIHLTDKSTPYERCVAWFDRCFHRYNNSLGGMNALINKSNDQLIGQCGLLIQTVDDIEELEIGYSLMPEYRSQGFAIEAAMKCRDHAFANKLSDSIISIIHIKNELSASVALRNGMTWEKQTVFNDSPVNIFRIST